MKFFSPVALVCVCAVSAGAQSNVQLNYGPQSLSGICLAGIDDFNDGPSLVTNGQITEEEVNETLRQGLSLGALGTVLHFTGAIMHAVALPMFLYDVQLNEKNPPFPTTEFILAMAGMALNFSGTLPSCVGAGRVEMALEDADIPFLRNKYRTFYIRSWIYEIAGWGLYGLGAALLRNTGEEIAPKIFLAGLYGIELGAEIYRAIATIGPIRYAKRAQRHISGEQRIELNLMPVLPVTGGIGVMCALRIFKTGPAQPESN
jgi:hypothetical protein